MKKSLIKISLILALLFITLPAGASDDMNLYFFYGDGCPHCAKEEKFLDKLERSRDDINIYRFEVYNDQDNVDLLKKIGSRLNLDISGVPILIIGNESVIGYYSDETTGKKILDTIRQYEEEGCTDSVAPILDEGNIRGACVHGCDVNDEECIHNCGCEADFSERQVPESVSIPFFGEVKIKDLSLPVLTVLIAGTDGFNPCAMWVLLFLISLLIGMEDKFKMWTLGSAFIIASGAVYFLFLSAWLNLFLFIGFIFWIRILVGLVAIGSGTYHLLEFYRNPAGTCKVSGGEKRRKLFGRMRSLVGQKSFIASLLGIVLLAVAVNMVELVCSAGLPAVYTQVLAMSGLNPVQYYSYLLLYILIFMLDDLFVFFVAMTTLQMKGISAKYSRWAGLIGGIIIFLLGVLLIFKPGWVMFG